MNRDRSKSRSRDKSSSRAVPSDPSHSSNDRGPRQSRWSSSSKLNRFFGNIERSIINQFTGNNTESNTETKSDSHCKISAKTTIAKQRVSNRQASNIDAATADETSTKKQLQEESGEKNKITSHSSSLKASVAKSASETLGKLTLNKCQQQSATQTAETARNTNCSIISNRLSIPPPHANDGARSYNLLFPSVNSNNNINTETATLLGFNSSATLSSYDANHENHTNSLMQISSNESGESNSTSINDTKNSPAIASPTSLATTNPIRSQQQTTKALDPSQTTIGKTNPREAVESGFSTYQSQSSYRAHGNQMYPSKYLQNTENASFSPQLNLPISTNHSHLTSNNDQHNNNAPVRQQQISQPPIIQNNNHQQNYFQQLKQHQFDLAQLQQAITPNSNQVPMQPTLNSINSQQLINPHQQQFATLGRSIQSRQLTGPTLSQIQLQHALNYRQMINASDNGQQIYANAPPKPRRYLYYDNTTTQNHQVMMSQLAARLSTNHNNQQHMNLPNPLQKPNNFQNQSHQINRTNQTNPGDGSAYQNAIQPEPSQQRNFAIKHQPGLIKSKSNLDVGDIMRFRASKRSFIQPIPQQPIYGSGQGVTRGDNMNVQVQRNIAYLPPVSMLSGSNLQRSKSVTHLLPEINPNQQASLHSSFPARPLDHPVVPDMRNTIMFKSTSNLNTTDLMKNQSQIETLSRKPLQGIMRQPSSHDQFMNQTNRIHFENSLPKPNQVYHHSGQQQRTQQISRTTNNNWHANDRPQPHGNTRADVYNLTTDRNALPSNPRFRAINPQNNFLFPKQSNGLVRQPTYNLMVQDIPNGFNSKSSLGDKIKHLLIGNGDNQSRQQQSTIELGNSQSDGLTSSCHTTTYQVSGLHANNEGVLAAPSSSSHTLMTQHPTAWPNNDVVHAKIAHRQQSSLVNLEDSAKISGALGKHVQLKNASDDGQLIDATKIVHCSTQAPQRFTCADADRPQQIDVPNLHQALRVFPSDKLSEMGNKQSRQAYQLDHAQPHNVTSPTSPKEDVANTQLIVDLTTPRVLAKTQTKLASTTDITSMQQRHDPWSMNQLGLPDIYREIEAKRSGVFSEAFVGISDERKNDLARTAPYYYSDLKSKEQRQALLNIVQQKSLSPPPQLLSRSTDQSSTRLAPKSATMHLAHARTLSENFQQRQRFNHQQQNKSRHESEQVHKQNNSSSVIAKNIDKLFDSSPVSVVASKSMLNLNCESTNVGHSTDHEGTNSSTSQNVPYKDCQFSKSKSLENICRMEKTNPVYENIRCSNKLMTAIKNSTDLGMKSNPIEVGGLRSKGTSLDKATAKSDESMDSILGSSLDDTDSNPDIIDEIEISSTDNHLNDINELIEQLRTSHSKLTEEYKSTLVRISKTINSKKQLEMDVQKSAKLARRLQLLEHKSKRCESRGRNQLALIQMMEKVLRQSKFRTDLSDKLGNKSLGYPTDVDSGQPTSFECDPSNRTSSNSMQTSSTSSQDRLSSSSCLSLDTPGVRQTNQNNSCKSICDSKCVTNDSKSPLYESSSPKRQTGDKRRETSENSTRRIIKAIVTESKNSQIIEFVKSGGASSNSSAADNRRFTSCSQSPDDPQVVDKGYKKNNGIAQRIHDLEKRFDNDNVSQDRHKKTKPMKTSGANPFLDASTDASGSSSSNDEEAGSKFKTSLSGNGIGCAQAYEESRCTENHTDNSIPDGEDDFIEFLDNGRLSGHRSQFEASQFSVSDFSTADSSSNQTTNELHNKIRTVMLENQTENEVHKTNGFVESSKKSCRSVVSNQRESVDILKSCNANSTEREIADESPIPLVQYQSGASLPIVFPASGKNDKSINIRLLERNDPSRRSSSSGISTSDQSLGKGSNSSDKFRTVLGNVIDVDVCPLVNSMSHCSPVNN